MGTSPRIAITFATMTVTASLLAGAAATQAKEIQAKVTDFFVGTPPHQVYIQRWTPSSEAASKKGPLIMVHGGAHTGTAWTTTPDGKPGWAVLFAERGWEVYVMDWPGVGRSGAHPANLNDTPIDLVDALAAVLQKAGPAVLVGHSIGGAVAFKLTERMPESVKAVAVMAPASVETVANTTVPAPLDKHVASTAEAAQQRFANAEKFPKEAFDNYFASLVPYSPRIRNAAVGLTDELKLDRTKVDLWKRVPTLVVGAEDDKVVPPSRLAETAAILGLPVVMLGRDWNMPGHAHLFVVEKGTEAIAARVEEWLSKSVKP